MVGEKQYLDEEPQLFLLDCEYFKGISMSLSVVPNGETFESQGHTICLEIFSCHN